MAIDWTMGADKASPAIALDPRLERAWPYGAACLPTKEERLSCLRQALAIKSDSASPPDALESVEVASRGEVASSPSSEQFYEGNPLALLLVGDRLNEWHSLCEQGILGCAQLAFRLSFAHTVE